MEINLIIGLPGSGKTTLARQFNNSTVIDDIKSLDQLPNKFKCLVITDVNFCDDSVLKTAMHLLRIKYPGVPINCIYFENNANKCETNVRFRDDGRYVQGTIDRFKKSYNPPQDALPIWQPKEY